MGNTGFIKKPPKLTSPNVEYQSLTGSTDGAGDAMAAPAIHPNRLVTHNSFETIVVGLRRAERDRTAGDGVLCGGAIRPTSTCMIGHQPPSVVDPHL